MPSGTGACAAAAASHRLGLVDNQVTVHMHGGELLVEFDGDGKDISDGTCRIYWQYHACRAVFCVEIRSCNS